MKLKIVKPDDQAVVVVIPARNGYTVRQGEGEAAWRKSVCTLCGGDREWRQVRPSIRLP